MRRKVLAVSLVLLMLGGALLVVYGCSQSSGGGSTTNGVSFASLGIGGVKLGYNSCRAQTQDTTSTITGHVYLYTDSSPMSGITVWAGTSISAETDSSGAFTLTGVPADTTVFTAIGPWNSSISARSNFYYVRNSTETMPSVIEFYAPFATDYDYVTLNLTVSDESHTPVAGAGAVWSTIHSMGGIGSTDASGVISHSVIAESTTIDQNIVCAGKNGVGGAYQTGISASSSPVTVHLTIGTPATAAGAVTSTSYSFSTYEVFSLPPNFWPLSSYFSFGCYATCASGTYADLKVPTANAGDTIQLTAWGYSIMAGHPYAIASYDIVSLTPTAGSSFTQNFSLPEPITVMSISSFESGGLTWVTVSWEAPTTWTPTLYAVGFGNGQGVVFTDDTTFTVPNWNSGVNPQSYCVIYALHCSSGSFTDLMTAMIDKHAMSVY